MSVQVEPKDFIGDPKIALLREFSRELDLSTFEGRREHLKKITDEIATLKFAVGIGDSAQKSKRARGAAFIKAAELILRNNTPIKDGKIKLTTEKLGIIKKRWAYSKQSKKQPISLRVLMKLLYEQVPQEYLCHAENHATWESKKREPIIKPIKLADDLYQIRTDVPITRFTTRQTKEWLKILKAKEKRPIWFNSLPNWEQQYLTSRIDAWNALREDPKPNLGDYLGVPPTTIRGYPGARNGYVSTFSTYKKEGDSFVKVNEVVKIRSGHITPDKMKPSEIKLNNSALKGKSRKEQKKIKDELKKNNKTRKRKAKREMLEAAKENIKQLILVQVQDKINKGGAEIDLLVHLQTLITPPIDATMNKVRLEAIEVLKAEISNPDSFANFLEENGIKNPEYKKVTMKLITSNHPVNFIRTFSNLYSTVANLYNKLIKGKDDKNYIENKNTVKALEERAEKTVKDGTRESKMAKDALDKIKSFSGSWSRFGNGLMFFIPNLHLRLFGKTLFDFRSYDLNHNVERAALEQIAVSALGGIRLGSCMSGKDREGGVSEHVAAMTAFYAKYGKFPPIPSIRGLSAEDEVLRTEYERMVAMEFLTGHEQEIAEANAPGASGLKEVKTILGGDVMKQVAIILKERAITRISSSSGNPKAYSAGDISKASNKIAKLNRIKKGASLSAFENKQYKDVKKEFEELVKTDKKIEAELASDKDIEHELESDEDIQCHTHASIERKEAIEPETDLSRDLNARMGAARNALLAKGKTLSREGNETRVMSNIPRSKVQCGVFSDDPAPISDAANLKHATSEKTPPEPTLSKKSGIVS